MKKEAFLKQFKSGEGLHDFIKKRQTQEVEKMVYANSKFGNHIESVLVFMKKGSIDKITEPRVSFT